MTKIKVFHVVRPAVGGMKNHLLELVDGSEKNHFHHLVACPPGDLAECLKEKGFTTFLVPIRGELSPRMDMAVIQKLVTLFKQIKPHIVHVHSSKAGLLGRLAAYIAGTPIVVMTIHGSLFQDTHGPWQQRLYALAEYLLSFYTHRIITVSEKLREEMIAKEKINSDKLITIYNGIRTGDFEQVPNKEDTIREIGIPAGKKIVGTVARLAPQKGVAYFIRSAALVAKDFQDVVFLVVGEGPLRQGLENLAVQLGLEGVVYFVGERKGIQTILPSLDIFVLASLTEGLPFCVLEALAARCPLVATNVGGIPEVVENGINGLLVNAGDVTALATAIKSLLSDPVKSKTMADLGHASMVERFTRQQMISRTEDVYRELLESAGTIPISRSVKDLG